VALRVNFFIALDFSPDVTCLITFGRNFPTHCLGETLFETVSGRISPKWTK
jgi:hypothetical protein